MFRQMHEVLIPYFPMKENTFEIWCGTHPKVKGYKRKEKPLVQSAENVIIGYLQWINAS